MYSTVEYLILIVYSSVQYLILFEYSTVKYLILIVIRTRLQQNSTWLYQNGLIQSTVCQEYCVQQNTLYWQYQVAHHTTLQYLDIPVRKSHCTEYLVLGDLVGMSLSQTLAIQGKRMTPLQPNTCNHRHHHHHQQLLPPCRPCVGTSGQCHSCPAA